MKKLQLLLNQNELKEIADSLEWVKFNGFTYQDLYCAKFCGEKISVKVRSNTSWSINCSLKVLDDIVDKHNILNKPIKIIQSDDTLVLISKWINGRVPYDSTLRTRIPEFFGLLGEFNRDNLWTGEVTSMYLDGQLFHSCESMAKFELNRHLENYKGKISIVTFENALQSIFLHGPCAIMEDINVGNLIVDDLGRCKIIDYDFLIRGNPLYQFDHLNLYKITNSAWYNFTDEAKLCASEFFRGLGVDINESVESIKAISILKILRSASFSRWQNVSVDWLEIDQKIDQVIKSGGAAGAI